MNLAQLLQMEKAGMFKVGENPTNERALIAGNYLNDATIKARLLPNMGWTNPSRTYGDGFELWEMTGSFVRNLGEAFQIDNFSTSCVDVYFERQRCDNSLKGFEMIVFTGPNRQIKIIHGMPNLKGGAFALYDSYNLKPSGHPTFSGSSYKTMREYITSAVAQRGM